MKVFMSWTLVLVEEWALSHTALYLFVSSPFPCPNALWILKFYLKAGTNGPLNVPFSRVGLVSSRHAGTRWGFSMWWCCLQCLTQRLWGSQVKMVLSGLEICCNLDLPSLLCLQMQKTWFPPEKPWDFSCFSGIFWASNKNYKIKWWK